MMTVFWLATQPVASGIQHFGATCSRHELASYIDTDPARLIMRAHRHNVDMHPRRARRDLRRLLA
jgi:hypothetical protein